MSKRRPNGEGMVRKIGKRWEGRIVVGHKTDGSPIFRYTYGKTQKELLNKMHQKMSEYHGVELNESSNMSLSEWLDLWLEKYMRSTVRESTFEGYLRIANNYLKPYLGDKKIAFITADDIQKMYVKLKKEGRKHKNPKSGTELSDSTVVRIHMMLHKAMDDAVKEHLVPKNPTHGTIPPKRNKPQIRILNDEQLEKFMTVIENDEIWCDFFYTELTTGLRRGEICGIKWEDFNEDEGSINIKRTVNVNKGTVTEGEPKTGKGIRKIYLPQSTVDKLKKKKTLSHSEWMFENPLNPSVPLAPNSAYNRMRVLLKNAGLPIIMFHDLRHTFATTALANGMDVKTLSAIIGHVSAKTTLDIYLHSTDTMQRQAADKIDRGICKNTEIRDDTESVPEESSKEPPRAKFEPVKGKYRKPGTGCITKINDRLYEGRYSPKGADGKRIARNIYAKTEEECEKLLAELIVKMKAEIQAEKEQIKAVR